MIHTLFLLNLWVFLCKEAAIQLPLHTQERMQTYRTPICPASRAFCQKRSYLSDRRVRARLYNPNIKKYGQRNLNAAKGSITYAPEKRMRPILAIK